MAVSARTYSREWEVPLPRQRVWDLLSNTDHFDQFAGFAPVRFQPAGKGDTTLAVEIRTRRGGLPVRYREYPYEFVRDERFSVLRETDRGVFRTYRYGVELADSQSADGCPGTLVRAFFEVAPRYALGLLVGKVASNRLFRTFDRYLEQGLQLEEEGKEYRLPQVPARGGLNVTELDRAVSELASRPVDKALISRLREHLATGGDDEVSAIRPYRLARLWQADRHEVLRLCLHATTAGMLRLRWEVLCPHCRAPTEREEKLAGLHGQAHCNTCGITYDAQLDRHVELRFGAHPSIRGGEGALYCVGAPSRTQHILVQTMVSHGERVMIPCPQGRGARLRVLALNHMVTLEGEAAEGEAFVTYSQDGWSHDRLPAAPTVYVENRSGRTVVVVLEREEWDPDIVTAARVTALQEFRDLFSSEVLAPGERVGIESVSLMFTDLQASTALYEEVGDASAYGKVRRHFDFLSGWIASNSGAVVKTIGDAMMAVFYSPEDAMKAALDIQSRVHEWNAAQPGERPIILKMGIHHGPAIAINAADRIDYFGRTVNIAARVERESRGGDLVISREVAEREGVRSLLLRYGAQVQPFRAVLKGIGGEVDLVRVRLPAAHDWWAGRT